MWRRSIRTRMTVGFVLAILPMLVMICGIAIGASTRKSEAMDAQLLQRTLDRAAMQISRGDWRSALQDLVSNPEIQRHKVTILVLDSNGRILRRTASAAPPWPWTTLIHRPGLLERLVRDSNAPTIGAPWETGAVPTHHLPWMRNMPAETAVQLIRDNNPWNKRDQEVVMTERLLLNSEPRWRVAMVRLDDGRIVIAAAPRFGVLAGQMERVREMLAACGLILLFVAMGAWLLVGRVLSPIQRLADQAHTASSHDLELRLESPSQDAEMVHLVGTLNGLLARLAQTAAIRSRFCAAASHELRTPLQALSGHLEVALSRERSAPEYREVLNEAYRQTQRLSRLTTDLLLLNRLEAAMPEQKEHVDVREVVEAMIRQHRGEMQSRSIRYTEEMDETITILAPPTHVEILVRNLVENAVKYADLAGRLHVALTPGETPRLEVTNDCAWDPAPEGEKLLEPFYRPDASRSARTGGNGLGLAICRAITRANGWRLELEPTSKGVRAMVLFSKTENPGRNDPGRDH